MQPEEIMYLVKVYQGLTGKALDVILCNMMPICGCVTVRTYLTEKISISFGCNNSREFAGIGRDRLAVGVPYKLFRTLFN